jgi:hypothetical protein
MVYPEGATQDADQYLEMLKTQVWPDLLEYFPTGDFRWQQVRANCSEPFSAPFAPSPSPFHHGIALTILQLFSAPAAGWRKAPHGYQSPTVAGSTEPAALESVARTLTRPFADREYLGHHQAELVWCRNRWVR